MVITYIYNIDITEVAWKEVQSFLKLFQCWSEYTKQYNVGVNIPSSTMLE